MDQKQFKDTLNRISETMIGAFLEDGRLDCSIIAFSAHGQKTVIQLHTIQQASSEEISKIIRPLLKKIKAKAYIHVTESSISKLGTLENNDVLIFSGVMRGYRVIKAYRILRREPPLKDDAVFFGNLFPDNLDPMLSLLDDMEEDKK